MMDLGSVRPGYRPKPWCTGKQLLSGFNLTGQIILETLVREHKLAGGGGRVGPKGSSRKKLKKKLTGAYSLIVWDFITKKGYYED